MTHLDIGDSVHLSGLVLPEGVRLVDLHEAHDDSDRQVVGVNAPRVEVESDDEDEVVGDSAVSDEADGDEDKDSAE